MNDLFNELGAYLSALEKDQMYRRLRCISSRNGCTAIVDGRECVLFCSNDYLNLSDHPRVKEAAARAVQCWGLGSSASRLICGTFEPHLLLEEKMASFLGKEAGLYFPSGWMANEALLRTLPGRDDLVLIDKLDHASIIDALRWNGTKFRTYQRGNLDRLERFLQLRDYRRKYIVTESVFSMDGDAADLKELVRLKEKYNAILIVDEAHGLGCMGRRGAGLCEQTETQDRVDIIVAPLGKAIGAGGCVIACNTIIREYLINAARSFIYTTAAAPSLAAGAHEALCVLRDEPGRVRGLQENAEYLRGKLHTLGLNIGAGTTQIIPILIGRAEDAMRIANALFERGFFVVGIRPPTVAPGTSRLRISVQYGHTNENLDGLYEAIKDVIGPEIQDG